MNPLLKFYPAVKAQYPNAISSQLKNHDALC